MTSYDLIPYPSYSYPHTDPISLAAIGRLFGMNPSNPEAAQVLEIGCASGGNIIPLAQRNPEASFRGIDLSSNQIRQAKKLTSELGLTNIKFDDKSILDVNFGDETYDYIIVHGVYSWVPKEVRTKIFDICRSNLAANGIVYISYNTLPGWNMVKTVRDMMLFHAQNFNSPDEKVLEARRMLKFAAENNKIENGPYKQILESEIKTLQKQDDNYLLHDHLEVVNDPCYLHEFITQAGEYGLEYLADADLPSMYIGNQPDEVSNVLNEIEDVVRQEQYLDFITNRRFRMTLLTHKDVPINRSLDAESLEGLYLRSAYSVKKQINRDDMKDLSVLEITPNDGSDRQVTISGRISATCFVVILEASPYTLTLNDVAEHTRSQYLNDLRISEILVELTSTVLQLIFTGVLKIRSAKIEARSEISSKPRIFPPAFSQAQRSNMVSNLAHEMVKLTDDHKLVIQYIDGSNSLNDIIKFLKKHIQKGELTVSKDGSPIKQSDDTFDDDVMGYLMTVLNAYKINSLLIE